MEMSTLDFGVKDIKGVIYKRRILEVVGVNEINRVSVT
jgi:hypothetical protein